MAKVFNKVKTAAGLEALYLQKKSKDDFKHEGEIESHLKMLKRMRAGIQLRHSLHTFQDKFKDETNAENSAGTQFSSAGGENDVEHWTVLGNALVDSTVKRQALLDTINKVNEEWKSFETNDLKKAILLADACNRALSDKEYYSKHDQTAVAGADKTLQDAGQKNGRCC